MSRPENQLPAEFWYNEVEARKYTDCTRVIDIQAQMTERAIELLNLKNNESHFILDVGCGSGLSGEVLSEENHVWVGCDISRCMLNVAVERESEGDLWEMDIGQGMSFRPGSFDAAISISAIQWLCVAAKKDYNPVRRLNKFFGSLYNCLRAGGRAVLQFYPDGNDQIDMITKAALKAGFSGGVVVDFPNSSKNKKLYLCIDAGGSGQAQSMQLIEGLQEEDDDEKVEYLKKKKHIQKQKNGKKVVVKKSKEWIQNKKESMRKQGKKTARDSKFTGRKRNQLGQIG